MKKHIPRAHTGVSKERTILFSTQLLGRTGLQSKKKQAAMDRITIKRKSDSLQSCLFLYYALTFASPHCLAGRTLKEVVYEELRVIGAQQSFLIYYFIH